MSELWYFTCEGKQMEPVTTTELKQLATSGYLRGADMVWQEGMPAWVKAESIPGLIPPGAPQAVLTKSDTPVPQQPNALDDNVEPRSRHRRHCLRRLQRPWRHSDRQLLDRFETQRVSS